MSTSPIALIVMIGVSAYVIKLWFEDYKSAHEGKPNERALPGATTAPVRAYLIAAIGAVVILAAETLGELALGLSDQQSKMTALFALYTLCAAFVEEIIFRGYIVVAGRGAWLRWVGVVVASVLFAALHPFLWEWNDGTVLWDFGQKAWFSTIAVFASSLWFYIVRFAAFNPQASMGPCFAGHLTKNVGVIAIKAAQGYLVGLY